MTGMEVLLYLAVGIGCGLIRLSAVAVGVIAIFPAVLGAYAFSGDGALLVLAAILIPLFVIEGAYFLTMLLMGRPWTAIPVKEKPEAGDAARRVGIHRKPHMREEQ